MGFPFPYKRFLDIHRAQFEPMVKQLGNFWVRNNENTDYNVILNKDPLKLWRLCSTAIWMEENEPNFVSS